MPQRVTEPYLALEARKSFDSDEESDGGSARGYWEDDEAEALPLDKDVYSLAISDMAQDFERCGLGNSALGVQASRFVADFLLLFGCITIQFFLLREVKKFVTAKAVHDIRIAYGAYELAMYGNDYAHCEVTTNGFCRGKAEFFDASLFDTLDSDLQAAACRIPLSQPLYFGVVLWLWTTTCMGQLLMILRQFTSVILRTQRSSESHMVYKATDGEPKADEGKKIIYQLTWNVKAIFVTCIILPRALIVSCLLWLGCRWLLATNNFADLILNAVALEFILQFGQIMYVTMAPIRNQLDLEKTKILPVKRTTSVGYQQLVYILVVNAATVTWVYCYMCYFQMVLPDYRWDLHDVCKPWIAERFAV